MGNQLKQFHFLLLTAVYAGMANDVPGAMEKPSCKV